MNFFLRISVFGAVVVTVGGGRRARRKWGEGKQIVVGKMSGGRKIEAGTDQTQQRIIFFFVLAR